MPVDNTLYDRLADSWWDEQGTLHRIRTVFNPPRFGYFQRVLVDTLGIKPAGRQALDIGCGGGLLAEDFARLGFSVTGIDPSWPSIAAARKHAREARLDIDYRQGAGESLPFPDASFDLAYCCDVLEHVEDAGRVVAETARIIKPGGVYCFDTINRTLRSKIFGVKLAQEWTWTNFLPAGLHAWEKFIKPGELTRLLQGRGLEIKEMMGVQARGNPFRLWGLLRRYKRGLIALDELGAAARFRAGPDMSIMYMGYAIKKA
jgi:2-polyprenyl-6-hydroxyphenyl methylase/3-demethylubiquinone-9 3-methyltransferase